ncbi:hypothetical protein [Streptomyces sp. LUP47B]|uniref:hypothetical protein n=1 Tax=Streptomyces sp. LUP47B TaxID=1890286 RepID=UPI000851811E|nr:hypothetical protein [Streptomyces sp. LUP47B]
MGAGARGGVPEALGTARPPPLPCGFRQRRRGAWWGWTHLANAPHGRYLLDAAVVFKHRGQEWRDRVTANRAVAYGSVHDPVPP